MTDVGATLTVDVGLTVVGATLTVDVGLTDVCLIGVVEVFTDVVGFTGVTGFVEGFSVVVVYFFVVVVFGETSFKLLTIGV